MNPRIALASLLAITCIPSGSRASAGSVQPTAIPADLAPNYVPNFPKLGTSQRSSDVIYFPQNQATASTYNMANMLCLVNRLRMSRGLHPVVYHESLLSLAAQHAKFQARYKAITHADSGGQIGDRVTALGFSWMLLLENVGGGADSEKAIMDAWIRSPGHLANILNPKVQFMGVHVTNGFWVQDFAMPLDPTYVPPPNSIDACPAAHNLYIYS